MRLDIYLHHVEPDDRLDRLLVLVTQLLQKDTKIMATLDDITAAVAAEATVEQSAITLLTSLHDQLAAALASQDPAAIQAVVDQLGTNTAALSAAIAANTPAAPTA